jgi:hypothetical protein
LLWSNSKSIVCAMKLLEVEVSPPESPRYCQSLRGICGWARRRSQMFNRFAGPGNIVAVGRSPSRSPVRANADDYGSHPRARQAEARVDHSVDIEAIDAELAKLRGEQHVLEADLLRHRVLALKEHTQQLLHPPPPPSIKRISHDRPWRLSPSKMPVHEEGIRDVQNLISKAESFLLSHRFTHPPIAGPYSPVRDAHQGTPPQTVHSTSHSASPAAASFSRMLTPARPEAAAGRTTTPKRTPTPGRGRFSPLPPPPDAVALASEVIPPPVQSPRRAALEQVSEKSAREGAVG